MLIAVRDNNNELQIKDILDIDFDMKVEATTNNKYIVRINSKYIKDGEFLTKQAAENEMINIAEARNNLENELQNW